MSLFEKIHINLVILHSADMSRAVMSSVEVGFRQILAMHPVDNESFEILTDIFCLGCMSGSAVASPIFFELQKFWFMDIFLFFVSSAAFMLRHQEEIKIYGAFTILAATFLGLAAYSSARTSLKELTPWMPIAICLFVLLTVYFFPKLTQSFHGDNDSQSSIEEDRSYGFQGTPVEPGSVQSERDIYCQQSSLEMERWLEHNTSHMGRPASRLSGRPSVRDSDIDLDEALSIARIAVQRMVSPSRAGYNMSILTQTSSDTGYPSKRFGILKPSHSSRQPRDYIQRSVSPESVAAQGPSTTSAELERPLLG